MHQQRRLAPGIQLINGFQSMVWKWAMVFSLIFKSVSKHQKVYERWLEEKCEDDWCHSVRTPVHQLMLNQESFDCVFKTNLDEALAWLSVWAFLIMRPFISLAPNTPCLGWQSPLWASQQNWLKGSVPAPRLLSPRTAHCSLLDTRLLIFHSATPPGLTGSQHKHIYICIANT